MLEKFDVVAIMQVIKNISKWKTLRDIEYDPTVGEDQVNDHNKIEDLIKITFLIRILKLIIILLNISFFVGMIFMIFADTTMVVA